MAKVWKQLQRSDADYTGNVTGTVDGETAANIKTKAIAGAASKVVTDAAFTANVLNVANANDALKNSEVDATHVGLGNVANETRATILGGTLTGNVTGTVGGTAVATIKSGAASGATANQDATATILAGTLTGDVSGTIGGTAVATVKSGAASGATANQASTASILSGNLTGTIGGTANATIKSGAAAGATANQASTATILSGNLTGTIGGTANATIKSGAAAGATANQTSTADIRSGTTATHVGLGSVTNESKATMFAAPTFTGTVVGVSSTHVGLGSVSNISTATMRAGVTKANVGLTSVIDQAITVSGDKLKFGGVAQTLDAEKVGGKTVAQAEASASSTAQTAIIGGAPGALQTLDALAAALGDNANYATTTTNALATKGKAPMTLVLEDVDGDATYTNDPANEVVGQVGVYSGNQYVVVDI